MDLASQMQCCQRVMDESVYEFNCVCVDSVACVAISIFYGVCVCVRMSSTHPRARLRGI